MEVYACSPNIQRQGDHCKFKPSLQNLGISPCLKIKRTGKMAQQIEVIAARPDTLSSTPRPHMVEGEN